VQNKKRVTSKEFVKKIADKVGYHQYEVADMLQGLYATIYEEIVEGNSIEFERLFVLNVKDTKNKPMNREGVWIDPVVRKTIKFRMSPTLENQLRRIAKENDKNDKNKKSHPKINPNPDKV
jgi:nucleoid DNA-binding protein